MLDPELRFEGFTHEQWTALLELTSPLPSPTPPATPAAEAAGGWLASGIIAVRVAGQLGKLVHTGRGRLPLDPALRSRPPGAAELARRFGARWALELERGALERIMDAAGARATRPAGLGAQYLGLFDALRAELWRGTIDVSWQSRRWPALGPLAVSIARHPAMALATGTLAPLAGPALERAWPAGHGVLLASFAERRLVTCVALRRGPRGIERILGPDALGVEPWAATDDLRQAHQSLRRLAERQVGPLRLGCSAWHGTLRALVSSARPQPWRRAVAAGELVLDPWPPGLALGLALAARLGN